MVETQQNAVLLGGLSLPLCTVTTNSLPLIARKASATLLQRANQQLHATLALEVTGTSQLVEIVGEFFGGLAKVEGLESLFSIGL